MKGVKIWIVFVHDKHGDPMIIPYLMYSDAKADFDKRCNLANAHYHTAEKPAQYGDGLTFNIEDGCTINLITRVIQ